MPPFLRPIKDWLLSSTPRSPTGRGAPNLKELISRLEAYEQWKSPAKLDFESLLGKETWAKYWSMWENVNAELRECQNFADSLRVLITEKINLKQLEEPRTK